MYTIGPEPLERTSPSTPQHIHGNRRRLSPLNSHALLQSRHRERLHDRPSWFCLHQAHLTEDLLLAGFGGRLDTSLDPAQTGKGEDPILLDLLSTKLSKARNNFACHVLLDLELGCQGSSDG